MITITNLSLFFGERTIFDNITFAVKPKDRIGVVGRNGAGKTTLFRVMAGLQLPDGGKIDVPGGKTIGYLRQDIYLNKGLTVMEETLSVFSEVKQAESEITRLEQVLHQRTDFESDAYHRLVTELAEWSNKLAVLGANSLESAAGKILHGLGFTARDFNRKTDEFSGGWQMRVVLAKLLLSQPDYLLLDEPTNHLDIESIIWLERFLIDYQGAVLLISHDKEFLDKVTTRTVEIEQARIHQYKSNYSGYILQRQERRERLEASFTNQQRVIAEKEKTINRFMAKATKTKLAQSMQKKLDKMERIELDEMDTRSIRLAFPEAERAGQVVLEVKSLSKNYGPIEVLNNVDLKMDRGDRLAFVGQNGQGKTTLARIIVGELEASSGIAALGHNVKIGYYAQNQSTELDPKLTVLETVEGNCPHDLRTKLRGILGAFLFSGEDVDKKVSVLSGGERARLSIAMMLLRPFNFLVMDEPTNHLDIRSKEVLKNALLDFKGSVIIVSHDRDFLSGLTNRVIEFRDHVLFEYPGDVNDFLTKRSLDTMREVEKRDSTKGITRETSDPQNVMSFEERKNLQKLIKKQEKEIENLEIDIQAIEKEMHEAHFYTRPDAAGKMKDYQQKKDRLDTLYLEWEQSTAKLESAG